MTLKPNQLLRYVEASEELLEDGQYVMTFEEIVARRYSIELEDVTGGMLNEFVEAEARFRKRLRERGYQFETLCGQFFEWYSEQPDILESLDMSQAKQCTCRRFSRAVGLGFLWEEDESPIGNCLRLISRARMFLQSKEVSGGKVSVENDLVDRIDSDFVTLEQGIPIVQGITEFSPKMLRKAKELRPEVAQVDVGKLLGKQ